MGHELGPDFSSACHCRGPGAGALLRRDVRGLLTRPCCCGLCVCPVASCCLLALRPVLWGAGWARGVGFSQAGKAGSAFPDQFGRNRALSWRRRWQPAPVLLSGKFHGRKRLAGYSPRGCKQSDTTKRLHFTLYTFHVKESWTVVTRAMTQNLNSDICPRPAPNTCLACLVHTRSGAQHQRCQTRLHPSPHRPRGDVALRGGESCHSAEQRGWG